VGFLQRQWNGSQVIDIKSSLFGIMDQIVKCEFVLSSSLHGMIFADSYDIPNGHIILSNKVIGGTHKFRDYLQSVNRPLTSFVPDMDISEAELLQKTQDFVKVTTDVFDMSQMNLSPFWESCPMHAVAYNRTRLSQLEFSECYTKVFLKALDKYPKVFSKFENFVTPACS
jgi:hypothetical protein